MVLNNKILSGLALGLSLAVSSCNSGRPDRQQPVNQNKDTIKEHPELGQEGTVDSSLLMDPNNCPACGMG